VGRAHRWEPYGVWTTPLARIAAATVRPGNTRQARSGLCNCREIDDGQQQNRGYGYKARLNRQDLRGADCSGRVPDPEDRLACGSMVLDLSFSQKFCTLCKIFVRKMESSTLPEAIFASKRVTA